jgi:hypothetical protein
MSVVVKGWGLCNGRRRGCAWLLATLDNMVVCTRARIPFGAVVPLDGELAAPYSAELPACAMVSHPSYSQGSFEPCFGYEGGSVRVNTYQAQ